MSIDERGRRAAHDLHRHVHSSLDSHAALDTTVGSRSRRRPARLLVAAALVAVLGVVGALVALNTGSGDGERVAVDDRGAEADAGTPLAEAPTATAAADPPPVPEDLGLPVTVDPSNDLQPGQEVTVAGEGFTPGQDVGVVMCALTGTEEGSEGGAVDLSACDFDDYVYATPDAEGRVSATWTVKRLVTTSHAGTVDCARTDVLCGVVIGHLGDYSVWGGAVVSFADGLPPLEQPTVSVTPNDGLRQGDTVTISGSGFTGEMRFIWLCRDDAANAGSIDAQRCWPLQSPRGVDDPPLADADGNLSVEVQVWRTFMGLGNGSGPVDCAVDGCVIVIDSRGTLSAEAVPVAFDPDGPLPKRPVLSVSSTEGLRPGDPLTVVVTDLPPGATGVVTGCASTGSGGDCIPVPTLGVLAEVQADATGRAEATLSVPAPDGFTCSPADPCLLMASEQVAEGVPALSSPAVPFSYR